ncbi:MAG: hypothetical protein Q9222_000756 [Ikaeria aurantiellina]
MGLHHSFRSEKAQVPGEVVFISNVEVLARRVAEHIQRLRTQVDRTLSKPMFQREVAAALDIDKDKDLADSDLLILLKYLARDRQVLAYDSGVVRIAGPNEAVLPVSKEDRAIASLKSLIQDIQEQVHILELEITNTRKKSERAVDSKNRPLALAALRSRKMAENVLTQRLDTLFQLEEVRDRIQQAADQVTIISVLKDSAEALRNLNSQVGSVSDVEGSLEILKEEVGKVEDINLAINQTGYENSLNDSSEIEDELDQLLRQAENIEAEAPLKEGSQQRRVDVQRSGNASGSGIEQSPSRVEEGLMVPKTASASSLSEETSAVARMSLDDEEDSSSRKPQPRQDQDKVGQLLVGS